MNCSFDAFDTIVTVVVLLLFDTVCHITELVLVYNRTKSISSIN